MQSNRFRTHSTSLTEDELLLLDVMFDSIVYEPMLRHRNFRNQFNTRGHSLSDRVLKTTLHRLVLNELLVVTQNELRGHFGITLTPLGGTVWSSERVPIWERFCVQRQPAANLRGRKIVSVLATSSQIREDFLRFWPDQAARTRHFIIRDIGLISWHPFEALYVGMASYSCPYSDPLSNPRKLIGNLEHHCQNVEINRTWWRTVGELQKFKNVVTESSTSETEK